MKTDALYLNLFETAPSLALHLAGYDVARANEYTCQALEFKRTFRVDVVMKPPTEDLPLILAEIQFQKDAGIYARIVAECATVQLQSPEYSTIRMVIFFANRSVDTGAGLWQPMVDAGHLHVVYLDEAAAQSLEVSSDWSIEEQVCLHLVRLTVSPAKVEADQPIIRELAASLVLLRDAERVSVFKQFFVNLYLSKYKHLTTEEIRAMIDATEIFDDIGESRAVQEYAEIQVQKATINNAIALVRAGIPLGQVANILGIAEADISAALDSSEAA